MKHGQLEHISWILDDHDTLTLTPANNMNNHSIDWNDYKDYIVKVIIEEGIECIYQGAFLACKNLKEVTLPNSLKIISDNLFFGCKSLKTIHIPNHVYYMGHHAFGYCESLQNINIPLNINIIHESTFLACKSLETINIPNNIKEIENNVFKNCESLQEIIISDNVKKIGSMAFYNCTSLKRLVVGKSLEYGLTGMIFSNNHLREIIVDKDNPYYESIDHVVYSKNIPQSILLYPSQKQDKSYTILEGTLSIGDRTFYQNPYIKQIYIPSSIKHIGVCVLFIVKILNIFILMVRNNNGRIQVFNGY